MVAHRRNLHSDVWRRPPGRRLPLAILLGGALLGLPAASSRAAIINVPANQPTPQAAVAAAASGDTVLFAPGIYPGGLWVDGKALVLASRFLTTGDTAYIAQTVLDTVITNACGGALGCAGDAVVEFGSGAGGSAVIGLTVRRGKDGIRSHARVDISWCHCIQNEDGADYQVGGRGTFSNSLFAYSTDDGIDLNSAIELTITHCTITENADDGIEFRLYPYGGPLLRLDVIGNRFIHNDSDGIQLIDSPDSLGPSNRLIRIERNLFVNNRKATVGCMPDQNTNENYSGAPILETVQFISNTVVGDGYGFVGGANAVAVNNVFANILNSALRRMVGNSIAAHNLLWNNGLDVDGSNVDLGATILANPLLAADYHLTPGSPAIDAGVASYLWAGGDVVNLPPTGYSGSAPDLGAYEYNANAPVARNDTTQVVTGGSVSVAAPGVLGNDTDPNLDPLTVVGATPGPYHGILTLNPNGSFQYTHNGDGAPRDSFVYEVSDGTVNTGHASVLIKIFPPNAPPVAAFDAFLVDINSTDNGLDVLGNDHDTDPADIVTLQSVNTAGTVGTAVIKGDLIEYAAAPGFTGFDYFSYTIRDIQGASASATVNVQVQDVDVVHLAVKVNAGADDAEESATGTMTLSSGDLEMTWDGSTQKVGMRFTPLAIPKAAQIRKAYVQFKVDEVWPDPTTLTLWAQAADSPTTFTTTAGNISARPLGTKSAIWVPPLWSVLDAAGTDQQTPNLTRVISEVVNRPGWASGNALAIIVTGTGHRVAKAFESDAPGAPMLHVEYVNAILPLAVEDAAPAGFALHGVSPSPARGPLRVEFSLAGREPATLELLDIAGRRMALRDLGALEAGRHRVELRELLPAGLYLVRLSQGGRSLSAKAVVVR